jgi:hypothetical protein
MTEQRSPADPGKRVIPAASPVRAPAAHAGSDSFGAELTLTRAVEEQIRSTGQDGSFIMGTTYMTSEVALGAVDHFCREVVRVSREEGY